MNGRSKLIFFFLDEKLASFPNNLYYITYFSELIINLAFFIQHMRVEPFLSYFFFCSIDSFLSLYARVTTFKTTMASQQYFRKYFIMENVNHIYIYIVIQIHLYPLPSFRNCQLMSNFVSYLPSYHFICNSIIYISKR